MFRTIGDRPSVWESALPAQVLQLPEELARVDALLDDPVFFAPFARHFHPGAGPAVDGSSQFPVECSAWTLEVGIAHPLGRAE